MIKVIIGTNTSKQTKILDPNTTLRQALEDAEIEYDRGLLHLDGAPISAGDIDKTFTSLGVTEKCFLISVVKNQNA